MNKLDIPARSMQCKTTTTYIPRIQHRQVGDSISQDTDITDGQYEHHRRGLPPTEAQNDAVRAYTTTYCNSDGDADGQHSKHKRSDCEEFDEGFNHTSQPTSWLRNLQTDSMLTFKYATTGRNTTPALNYSHYQARYRSRG